MVNGWKVTAIIFIVISLLQFLVFAWAFNYGTQIIEKENECSINICSDYSAYYYDEYISVCYCYEDNDIVYQEYLK